MRLMAHMAHNIIIVLLVMLKDTISGSK